MTPDQLDRLQLAILNMVLLDDGDDPITLVQLQAENAKDPTEAAEQRAKVAKLAAVMFEATGITALFEVAAKGAHRSELWAPSSSYRHTILFPCGESLKQFEDAWRTASTAVRDGR